MIRTGNRRHIHTLKGAAGRLGCFLGNNVTRAIGKGAPPERGKRFLQHDGARVFTRHLHVIQSSPVTAVGRLHCRINDALVGKFDVFSGHFTITIAEHDAGTQSELDVGVVYLFNVFRCIKFGFPFAAGLEGDQFVEDGAANPSFWCGEGECRVEYLEYRITAQFEYASVCAERNTRVHHCRSTQCSRSLQEATA